MKQQFIPIARYLSLFVVLNCIIVEKSFAQRNPILGAGNSYVNISKKNTGGVVEPGDTIEIRTTYFFSSNYNTANAKTLYKIRYYDSVPINTTMLAGINDSIRLITNEGLTFRKYTLTGADDAGAFRFASGVGRYQIRINIGVNPGIPPGGTAHGNIGDITGADNAVIGTYKPRIFGGLLITTAFRVQVTGAIGDTIKLATGKLVYKKTNAGADTVIIATPYKILISGNLGSGICSNGLGRNLASEYGGTFDSGSVHNRVAGPFFFIPNYDYRLLSRSLSFGDGNYGFVNNLSPLASTNINARRSPNCNLPAGPIPVTDSCVNRMHGGFWDIMGDHTGSNNAIGNPPITPGTNGGYMLVVNSDVVTSEAYKQSIATGLCENTYYEFSAWIKNVCKTCGIDSASVQRYNPGVLPNLAFSVNGVDYYSTGQLDTIGWQRKGFIFKTAIGQTSAIISIRNNAPGGGGNDWALDDIRVSHCGPSIAMNYNPYVLTCRESATLVTLSDTVRYLYDNSYVHFKWQKSNVGGTIWTDMVGPGTSGIGTPVLVNGQYEYSTTLPPFPVVYADSGTYYRVQVATTAINLTNNDCIFTDGNITMIRVITCGIVLQSEFLSFKGSLSQKKAFLSWNTKAETNLGHYEIERSENGSDFIKIGSINAKNTAEAFYNFSDQDELNGKNFYRLKMVSLDGKFKYSQVIVLSNALLFEITKIENPFKNSINTTIVLPNEGLLEIKLFDSKGQIVKRLSIKGKKGINSISIENLAGLSNNVYILSAEFKNEFQRMKLIKIN